METNQFMSSNTLLLCQKPKRLRISFIGRGSSNIFDNNLSNSSFVTNKSDNSMNMSAQTTTSSIKESAKKRPGSSMKKN